MHVFSRLSPLSLDMIRWLAMDHSVHDKELSCDREISLLEGEGQ
jgi:hypothetical protein